MVGGAPLEQELKAGDDVTATLRARGLPIDAAAWVLGPDTDRWTLNVVSDWKRSDLADPYAVLSHVIINDGVLDRNESLYVWDVVPVTRDSKLGRALIELAASPSPGRRRTGERYAAGIFIPDAIVYKTAA